MSFNYHIEDETSQRPYDAVLMKRLLQYLRPHVRLLAIAATLLLLATVLGILSPLITKQVIDGCIGRVTQLDASEVLPDVDARSRTLVLLMALMVSISVIEAVFQYSLLLVLTFVGQKTLLTMRLKVFSHLQQLSVSFLDRNPVGRLMTRVTNDVENIQQTIVTGMVYSLGEVLSILLVLSVMLVLNWRLTLVTLCAIPLVMIASYIFRKFVRRSYQEVRRKIATVNAYTQEMVSGMKIVQLFGFEDRGFKLYRKLNADHRDEWFRQVRYHATYFQSPKPWAP